MSAPEVGVVTQRAYDRLPAFYRHDDADDGDYPLMRYMSAWLDQASEVETILDRVRDGLADPALADAAWLPWLAQMVGVTVEPDVGETELREAIANAVSGWRVGTKAAVADAARTALIGARDVWIYDHSTDASVGGGGPWDLLVVTRPSETPDVSAVLAAIVRKHAKPAGVRLWHRSYSASWTLIETTYPTWNAIEAAGSWTAIEQTGV